MFPLGCCLAVRAPKASPRSRQSATDLKPIAVWIMRPANSYAASMQTHKPFALVQMPNPLATPEKWEQHLDLLRKLPDDTDNKEELIASAEKGLAMSRA